LEASLRDAQRLGRGFPSVTPGRGEPAGRLVVFAGSGRSERRIGEETDARCVRGSRGHQGAARMSRPDTLGVEPRCCGDVTSAGSFGWPGQSEASEMENLLVLLELHATRRGRHRHGEIETTQEDQQGKKSTAHDVGSLHLQTFDDVLLGEQRDDERQRLRRETSRDRQ